MHALADRQQGHTARLRFSGSCSEIYLERAFPPEWRPQQRLAVARELGETSLMFLVHPTLRPEHIAQT